MAQNTDRENGKEAFRLRNRMNEGLFRSRI